MDGSCVSFIKVVNILLFFLRDSGREFQTVGPKTEKERSKGQRGVKRAQRPKGTVWMQKVRNIWWHAALIDTLKAETNIFALNPSLHCKPVECSEQF